EVWKDRSTRRALLAGQELPRRPGALATFEPATQANAVYNTDLQIIFYDDPVLGSYETWFREIADEPRYTNLKADQRAYRHLYARIEDDRRPLSWWLKTHPELRSQPEFPAFYARFYDDIGHGETSLGVDAPRPLVAGLGD